MKISNHERYVYVALIVALLVIQFTTGVFAQGGANVQEFKAARILNWLNIGTDLSVGGNSSITGNNAVAGNETVAGTLGVTGAQSNSNVVNIAAPTAVGTATPALLVNSAGVSNLLSLRKNSTPVFQVSGAGVVNGYVLEYGAARGQAQICGTTNITSSTVLAHGFATPSYVNITMAQDATGDGARITYTNSAGVVTAKGWNSALTPAAATTPIAASWCVIGTP